MTEALKEIAEQWRGYEMFQPTELSVWLDRMPHKTLCISSGNRAGKTGSVAKHYVDRVMGVCNVPEKNRLARKVRCMSSSLPEQTGEDEDDNAQYLELKKRIPPSLIISDITARNKNLVIRRPGGLNTDKTIFEFRSSKQETQDLGKISLSSVWHDEETPKEKRNECRMRLMEEGGDEIFTLTAINPISYVYDEVWQRAEYIYSSKTIVSKLGIARKKYPNKNTGIACFQMATDDNPILDTAEVDRIFEDITDPDDLLLRRYGVFKAISGAVHKSYNSNICYIDFDKVLPDGIPYRWVHARGIDYHESRTPWSVGWLSASPDDEWFLWQEMHPAIDGPNAYNTYEIAQAIARRSLDYYYTVNLIDPLANKKQANTLFSTTEDLNRYLDQIRKDTGVGTPTWWEGWDTKGTTGRDEIKKRFKNAVRCGKPFNNRVVEKGRARRLPTLWISHRCPKFNKSILSWRFGEYVTSHTKAVNDPKNVPQQRWSHDNMVLECLGKDARLLHAAHMIEQPPRQAIRRKSISVTGR